MAFEMIDRDERLVAHGCNRFGSHHSYHDPTNQTGACRGRHGVERVEVDTCFDQRLFDEAIYALQMTARSDFRYDAPIEPMLVKLGENQIRTDTFSDVSIDRKSTRLNSSHVRI